MIIKNDYGKDMLILDEENLIFKHFFGEKIIKREDIRSVFYDENTLGILNYNGKVYSINITSVLFSERKMIEELRLQINKENILFNYIRSMNYESSLPITLMYIIMLFNLNFIDNEIYSILLIAFFIIFIILTKKIRPRVIYNIDTNEVEVFKWRKNLKYKREELDKIKLKKISEYASVVEFINNKKKYKLYFMGNSQLTKIYNTSLNELFN
ncbi:MAG: hypothetical protein ACI33I_04640 [Clostridium sp.]